MSDFSTEVLRRVYDDNEGVFIQVGPGPDGFGISISTADEKSTQWFGRVDLTLDKDLAAALGNALIAAAKEAE